MLPVPHSEEAAEERELGEGRRVLPHHAGPCEERRRVLHVVSTSASPRVCGYCSIDSRPRRVRRKTRPYSLSRETRARARQHLAAVPRRHCSGSISQRSRAVTVAAARARRGRGRARAGTRPAASAAPQPTARRSRMPRASSGRSCTRSVAAHGPKRRASAPQRRRSRRHGELLIEALAGHGDARVHAPPRPREVQAHRRVATRAHALLGGRGCTCGTAGEGGQQARRRARGVNKRGDARAWATPPRARAPMPARFNAATMSARSAAPNVHTRLAASFAAASFAFSRASRSFLASARPGSIAPTPSTTDDRAPPPPPPLATRPWLLNDAVTLSALWAPGPGMYGPADGRSVVLYLEKGMRLGRATGCAATARMRTRKNRRQMQARRLPHTCPHGHTHAIRCTNTRTRTPYTRQQTHHRRLPPRWRPTAASAATPKTWHRRATCRTREGGRGYAAAARARTRPAALTRPPLIGTRGTPTVLEPGPCPLPPSRMPARASASSMAGRLARGKVPRRPPASAPRPGELAPPPPLLEMSPCTNEPP